MRVVNQAMKAIGRPYDFGFDPDDHEAFYCSELVRYALDKAGVNIGLEPREIKTMFGIFKKTMVLPEDFLDFPGLCLVYMHDKGQRKNISAGC